MQAMPSLRLGPVVRVVSPPGGLHLDDVGAHVAHQYGGIGTEDDRGQVDDVTSSAGLGGAARWGLGTAGWRLAAGGGGELMMRRKIVIGRVWSISAFDCDVIISYR